MSDATLLQLEAEFNAASDRWDAATANTAKLEEAVDDAKDRLQKAEAEESQKAEAASNIFDVIMNIRASTLAGMLAKVRVRDRWATDDRDSEVAILKSLVADLKAIAKESTGN